MVAIVSETVEKKFRSVEGGGGLTRKSKKTKSAKTEIERLLPQRLRMDMSAEAELKYHGLY